MKQEKLKKFEAVIRSDYDNIAGIVIQKNGKTLYEGYFNGCAQASRIHVYSVTKSIVSILIGIAIEKGYIGSIDQKVTDFFPNYGVKDDNKTIRSITLRNLLTMTAPYKHTSEPYEERNCRMYIAKGRGSNKEESHARITAYIKCFSISLRVH